MASVAWSFYKTRRRINLHALVSSGRVVDYATFVSYCNAARVIPATQQEFEIEFGPLLKGTPIEVEPAPVVLSATDALSVSDGGLEATVWLAGVDDDTTKKSTPPPPKQKKKKAKDSGEDSQE